MEWQRGLSGYLEIELWGKEPERVINMAMTRGIHLWDIRQKDKGYFLLKIRIGGYKALRHLVRKSACHMKIKHKRGMWFCLRRAQKRKMLLGGILFFCLALYVMSSFVWFIEVQGNKKIATTKIEQTLDSYGLRIGVLKSGLDSEELRKKLLLEIPEIAWAGFRIQGTKVIVEVAEKTLIPDDEDTKPADIVARSGGKIEEILVLTGTPLIKEGDFVEKGQALILRTEEIRARALVRARVERSQIGECFVSEEKVCDTGATVQVIVLRISGHDVIIRGPKTLPYERYRVVTHAKKLDLGRICNQSVELITMVYLEQQHEIYQWGLAGAYEEAAARARTDLYAQLPPDFRIVSERHEPQSSNDEGLVRVRYEIETIEDIAFYIAKP